MTIVDTLATAKTGDTVWLYDAQASNYENRKYLGRGVWRERMITGETRLSFTIGVTKFDRKTGEERAKGGYSSMNIIAGQKEREAREWFEARYKISEMVRTSQDAEALKKIAALIGFSDCGVEELESVR